MHDSLVSVLLKSLGDDAIQESGFLLEKAGEFLDKKYGEGFAKENPETVIKLSYLYAFEVISSALLLDSIRSN